MCTVHVYFSEMLAHGVGPTLLVECDHECILPVHSLTPLGLSKLHIHYISESIARTFGISDLGPFRL